MEVTSLANMRAKGEGLPYTKPTGTVLYRLSDVLEAERDGQRGFSWAWLAKSLKSFHGLPPNQRLELVRHLKRMLMVK